MAAAARRTAFTAFSLLNILKQPIEMMPRVITDVFVICSGANERQVKSIVDAIEEALHAKGVKPIRREGMKGAHWVLLDFGDVVVHVQQAEDRVHYAIERLWKDCPDVELPESVTSGQTAPSE